MCAHIIICYLGYLPSISMKVPSQIACWRVPSLSLLAFEEAHSDWTLPGLDSSVVFATMHVDEHA